MIGLVIVTHGRLALEFRAALEHIVGPQSQLETISIGPEDDPNARRADILNAIRRTDSGQGVIVLTDMFGGTPTNLSLAFLEKDRVEVLTGVNLPMLIKLINLRQADAATLSDIARDACAQAKESIYLASDLIESGRADS